MNKRKPYQGSKNPYWLHFQDRKRSTSAAENLVDGDHENKKNKTEDRIKKRKVAMMFAYSGVGYFGLQRNSGMKTIEGDIMDALFKAGLCTDEQYRVPQLIFFQRAARTDKGVSALKQIVSLKLPETATVENINKYLPEQIRIFSIKRVTKGFNSKNNCDARTYSYTCPTYAFAPAEQTSEAYRLTEEQLNIVRALLKQYEGTHNFHNFTSKRKPMDPSCTRYIMMFECSPPFIRDGMEMVTITVKGQSFMLHQIRKMIGLVMAIARGHTSEDLISKTFDLEQYDLPVAPGLGLLLEQVHYQVYDEKYGQDGVHETLHFLEHNDEVNAFREKFILPYVTKIESEEKPMLAWLETLPCHSYDLRSKVNPNFPGTRTTEDEIDDEDDDDNKNIVEKPFRNVIHASVIKNVSNELSNQINDVQTVTKNNEQSNVVQSNGVESNVKQSKVSASNIEQTNGESNVSEQNLIETDIVKQTENSKPELTENQKT